MNTKHLPTAYLKPDYVCQAEGCENPTKDQYCAECAIEAAEARAS